LKIPFTVEQFFDVFGTYNTAIWPMQVVAYLPDVLHHIIIRGIERRAIFKDDLGRENFKKNMAGLPCFRSL